MKYEEALNSLHELYLYFVRRVDNDKERALLRHNCATIKLCLVRMCKELEGGKNGK